MTDTRKCWQYGRSDSWGIKGALGMEAKLFGVGFEMSVSGGFEKEYTTSVEWNKSTEFEGRAGTVPGTGPAYRYQYCPYFYLTSAVAPERHRAGVHGA